MHFSFSASLGISSHSVPSTKCIIPSTVSRFLSGLVYFLPHKQDPLSFFTNQALQKDSTLCDPRKDHSKYGQMSKQEGNYPSWKIREKLSVSCVNCRLSPSEVPRCGLSPSQRKQALFRHQLQTEKNPPLPVWELWANISIWMQISPKLRFSERSIFK